MPPPASNTSVSHGQGTKGPVSVALDSLDAKIVQYHYASQKILKIITEIKELIKKTKSGDEKIAPLVRYIILLNGSIFNVNDNLYRRAEILVNGGKFNPVQTIDPPLNLNYVNYDVMDNSTNYDTTQNNVPELKKSLDSLRLLELLLINTYEIYNKRLKQALVERKNIPSRDSDFDFEALKDLMNLEELASIGSSFAYVPDQVFKSQDQLKHYLRNVDYEMIALNIQNFQKAIDAYHPYILTLTKCKTREDILKLPNYRYTLHRIFFVLMRLADLYGVIRKFGKVVYLNNSHYFENYLRFNEPLKKALSSMDNYFLQSKKNNLLLAQLVRFSRQGSILNLRLETLFELSKHSNAGYNLLNLMIKAMSLLYVEWKRIIDSNRAHDFDKDQLRERVRKQAIQDRENERRKSTMINSTITKKMEAMYINPNKVKQEKEQQSRLQKELEDSAKEERLIRETELKEKEQAKIESVQAKTEDRERQLREELALKRSSNESSPTVSRSSSILRRQRSSSITSNGAQEGSISDTNNLATVSPSNAVRRSASLRSPAASRDAAAANTLNRRNSLIISNTPKNGGSSYSNGDISPLANRTRHSMIIQSSAGSSSAGSVDSSSVSSSQTETTPRNNQVPQIFFPDSANHSPQSAIAGAAASVRTIQQRINEQQKLEHENDINSKEHIRAAATQAHKTKQPVRLTARQRLQQHIIESTQSGQMNSKVIVNKPTVFYHPGTGSIRSPNSSRTSSLQSSNTNSPLNSITVDNRQAGPNRSRSNSADQNTPLESPVLSRVQQVSGRVRSNSASKRPGDNIPDIQEETNNSNGQLSASSNGAINNNSNGNNNTNNIVATNGTPFPTLAVPTSSHTSETSSVVNRSRSGSTRSNIQRRAVGNLLVVHSQDDDIPVYNEDGSMIKKVRFFGVQDYSEDEDAPSPQQSQKQIRKMWSRVTPNFIVGANGIETRKKDSLLVKQEGMAFRKFQHQSDGSFAGFSRNKNVLNDIPVDSSGKFSMMSMVANNNPQGQGNHQAPKKLTQLFKRR